MLCYGKISEGNCRHHECRCNFGVDRLMLSAIPAVNSNRAIIYFPRNSMVMLYEMDMVDDRTLNLECLHWFESHMLLVSELGHFRSLHDAPYFSFELHFEFMCGQHFVSLIVIVSVYIIKSITLLPCAVESHPTPGDSRGSSSPSHSISGVSNDTL